MVHSVSDSRLSKGCRQLQRSWIKYSAVRRIQTIMKRHYNVICLAHYVWLFTVLTDCLFSLCLSSKTLLQALAEKRCQQVSEPISSICHQRTQADRFWPSTGSKNDTISALWGHHLGQILLKHRTTMDSGWADLGEEAIVMFVFTQEN